MKEKKNGLIPLSVEFISDLDRVETKFHKFQSKTERVSELRKNEMVKYGNDIFRVEKITSFCAVKSMKKSFPLIFYCKLRNLQI